MVINDERKGKYNYFEKLSLGDVFTFEDRIFMKTEKIEFGDGDDDDYFYNAVDIKDGVLVKFEEDDSVIPLVVQLRILREA